jgi:hypothetical protein
MTRLGKFLRFTAVLVAVWTIGGADWPIDDVMGIIGGLPCC